MDKLGVWMGGAAALLVGCVNGGTTTSATLSGPDSLASVGEVAVSDAAATETAPAGQIDAGSADSPAAPDVAKPNADDATADLGVADSDAASTEVPVADADAQADAATDTAEVDAAPACNSAACPPAPQCQVAVCENGVCATAAKAEGQACEDGDACTKIDVCTAGVCKPGPNACAAALPAGVGASPCKLVGDLPKASSIALVPWFTQLTVSQPIHMTHFPDGTDRMVVVSRPGQINLFANDPNVKTQKLVLNIQSQVNPAGEGGLLSVAFHPKFKQNKKFYVNYTSTGTFSTVVSEFTMSAADPEVADPATEKKLIVIVQPYTNHNGGQIYFDTEGFLHIAMGDGGSGGDPLNAGQDKQTLLGKILRIDVDKAEGGKPYAIPKNNPFVANAAYKPEIFALGMRNPWRVTVDRLTGEIWAADVGQNKWEEIDIVQSGKNYGWRILEGKHCFNPATNCDSTGMTMPVAELPHGQSNSITGGFVYRGSQNPALYGAYLSGDYDTGKYWTTVPDGNGGYTTKEVLDTADHPVTFGEDRDGELYVAQIFPAKIWKVVQQTTTAPPGPALPKKLSETGCFSNLQTLQPAAGVVPYDLNAPLWSDGAHKRRWLVLPTGATPKPGGVGPIGVPDDPSQSWNLPVGTLLIKHFALGDGGATPVETRILRRDATSWSFWTFRWQADGKDADLWLGGGQQAFAVTEGGVNKSKTWTLPSQAQCGQCHRAATQEGLVLGVQSAQLDRVSAKLGGLNQIDVFAKAGLFAKAGVNAGSISEFADLQGLDSGSAYSGALGPAARAYLHSNCAHCHRPGGGSPSDLDLRYSLPLGQTKSCGLKPQAGDLGIASAQIVAPGSAAKSVLVQRMLQTPQSGNQMPPLAVAVPHAGGAKLVSDWIAGLPNCNGP